MIVPEPLLANEVLDALAAHVAVLDPSGAIVCVNEAWRRFAIRNGGPAAGAYIGANYFSVCVDAAGRGDAMAACALAGIEEVLRGEREEFSLEYPCDAPGQERWFRMSVTRFVTGRELYLVVAHEDITAHKQSQHALQEAERLLRSVLAALPIGVWVLDRAGRIVQGNAAGLRVWGGARYVGPEEFGQYKGWWLSTGEPIAAEDWAATRAVRKGETSIDEEVAIECFDGSHKIILNSAVPLFDSEHRIAGAIIVNQDVTARKQAEAEREAMLREHDRLRQAALDANRAKDDFIAMLSHELRTPLQSVRGWASILKGSLSRVPPDTAVLSRAVSSIERNTRIQEQLLNDTLDISRIVRKDLRLVETDVDLSQLVREVADTMRPAAADKGITVVEDVPPGPIPVRGDPIRLQQMVWNLLENAVKFTPSGGRIEVNARLAGDSVEVAVRDNGLGIAPEFMPFLFDRFRQGGGPSARTRAGLGLGLAIVKELAELHRGTISAESAGEGRGATFTLRLPLMAGASSV